jgi:hypothetical protein
MQFLWLEGNCYNAAYCRKMNGLNDHGDVTNTTGLLGVKPQSDVK